MKKEGRAAMREDIIKTKESVAQSSMTGLEAVRGGAGATPTIMLCYWTLLFSIEMATLPDGPPSHCLIIYA